MTADAKRADLKDTRAVNSGPPTEPTPTAAIHLLRPQRRTFDKYALLMIPAVLLVLVVFLYPVGLILIRAFTHHSDDSGGVFDNFIWYFGSEVQRTVLLRTFTTSALVTLVCLVLCYPFALVMTRLKRSWFMLALAVVLIAAMQSILVRTFSWRVLLRESGPVNDFFEAIGLGRITLLGTTTGVVIAMCQVMAPFMILSLYSNLRGIDRRLNDAAQSLGSAPLSAFFRVSFPLSLPGIAAGSLLVFILSLGFYITPAVVGSPQNSLLSQAIVNEVQAKLDWGHAGAMAMTLLLVTLLFLGLLSALLSKPLAIVSGKGVGK